MLGANELARLRDFYTNCQQLDSDAQLMLDGAEPAMIFHVLVLDDAPGFLRELRFSRLI